MNRYSFLARFKEPPRIGRIADSDARSAPEGQRPWMAAVTWAALAAGLAIVTGHDPALAADTALQIAGVGALAGVAPAGPINNRNPPLL